MKIKEIWNEQESGEPGLLLRRYTAEINPDIYIAFRNPEKQRCIAIQLDRSIVLDLSRYSDLTDINLKLIQNDRNNGKQYFLISLLNNQHQDVFATLCEDLISGIATLKEDKKIIKELVSRLGKWKSLFHKAATTGLDPEEQRGLYGELYFLRKWLSRSDDLYSCVYAWLGPERELRDFQKNDVALEIKTTFGNNHQKIQINSERQLDINYLRVLILCHLSLESQQQNGETLNQMVDAVIRLLEIDPEAQTLFRSKLLLSGYFFHQKALYETRGYNIRKEIFYTIRDKFPRVEEKDLPKGVGDLKYSIMLTDFSEYIITDNTAFEMIN